MELFKRPYVRNIEREKKSVYIIEAFNSAWQTTMYKCIILIRAKKVNRMSERR